MRRRGRGRRRAGGRPRVLARKRGVRRIRRYGVSRGGVRL